MAQAHVFQFRQKLQTKEAKVEKLIKKWKKYIYINKMEDIDMKNEPYILMQKMGLSWYHEYDGETFSEQFDINTCDAQYAGMMMMHKLI